MSGPQTIREYLAALNASLEIGLRSRRRIFLEVGDHLSQAAEEELRRGASPNEAERLAITAFGSPEAVAARFEAGLFGALDRRLTVATRRACVWLSGHPAHAALARLLPWLLIGTLTAAVGTAFGGQLHPGMVVGWFLGVGTVWSYRRRRESQALGFRPERVVARQALARPVGDWSSLELQAIRPTWSFQLMLASAICGVYSAMLEPTSHWGFIGSMCSLLAALCAGAYLTERLASGQSRDYPGATDEERRRAWRVDHPWWAALFEVSACPLGMLALLVVWPAPAGLRLALGVLLVAITALVVVAERLAQSRVEADAGPEWST